MKSLSLSFCSRIRRCETLNSTLAAGTKISCLTVCFAHKLRMEATASFHRFFDFNHARFWFNLVTSVIELMDESFIFIVEKWYCFLVRSWFTIFS